MRRKGKRRGKNREKGVNKEERKIRWRKGKEKRNKITRNRLQIEKIAGAEGEGKRKQEEGGRARR